MTRPTAYDRQFNFQNWEAEQPTAPKPGAELDAEFNAVKLASDQTQAALARIQRSDGALANGVVTQDALAAALSIGFTLRPAWSVGVNYVTGDGTSLSNKLYRAKVANLSSNLNRPDLDTTTWELLVDLSTVAVPNFVGDTGVGGASGRVPAPAAGDAAAHKFLRASGGWAVPDVFGGDSGTGGFSGAVPAPAPGDAAALKFLSASGVFSTPPMLRFDAAQGLTSPQQLQARQNAGVVDWIVAQSLGTNGYVKFNGGLIVQWGKIVGTGADAVVTYPIGFTAGTTPRVAISPDTGSTLATTTLVSCSADQISAVSFAYRPRAAVNGGSVGVASLDASYIAIGS